MELWIRSQDKKELLKVSYVSIRHIFEQKKVMDNYGRIVNFINGDYKHSTISNGNINLGSYKTKERALEVLDEIQNILKPKPFIKAENNLTQENLKDLKEAWLNSKPIIFNEKASIQELSTYVYEMPEE